MELAGDPIFQIMPPEALLEVAQILSFKPYTNETPHRSVRSLTRQEQLRWFDAHRRDLEDEVCRVGSWTFGEVKSYGEIVRKLAKKLKIKHKAKDDIPKIERAILARVWNNTVAQLTPDQIEQLKAKASEIAAEHGKNLSSEMAGFATLSAAQLSGFGVYVLGSTLLGAINGALGLGLGFGVFTGLSSMISAMIGPAGWALLGAATVVHLGAPNYKKILPIVILAAIHRTPVPPRPFWKRPKVLVFLTILLLVIWHLAHR